MTDEDTCDLEKHLADPEVTFAEMVERLHRERQDELEGIIERERQVARNILPDDD